MPIWRLGGIVAGSIHCDLGGGQRAVGLVLASRASVKT
jgi:hypothetical protein